MDLTQKIAIDNIDSMLYFAGDDETILIGDYLSWKAECNTEGRLIPPSEFKSRPKRVRHETRPIADNMFIGDHFIHSRTGERFVFMKMRLNLSMTPNVANQYF